MLYGRYFNIIEMHPSNYDTIWICAIDKLELVTFPNTNCIPSLVIGNL